MAEPIISVSGLRGVIGQTLTPDLAIRYVAAFAAMAGPGPLVVGRDGRFSGEMLSKAICAGLHAVGRDTLSVGVAATPTVGVLVRSCQAAGGIQITASHNPAQYNGIKLFSSDGRVIPAGPGQQVLNQYRGGQAPWVAHESLGRSRPVEDPLQAHLNAVLATVDVEAIRRRQFKVLLDSNHGAGSLLGRRLLETLGCTVTLLGGEPDGLFEHLPEPTAENLAGVRSAVPQAGACVGFCQDPDADRLAVIDESGRYVGEEYTLAMCVDHLLRRMSLSGDRHGRQSGFGTQDAATGGGIDSKKGPIVANCATSRMSEDLAGRYGVPYFRAAVGEANVVDAMLIHGAAFGGEGNGGPIDPRVGMVRDSFVGMAQLLDAMAQRQEPISRLADELPQYRIVKTKVTLPPERVADAMDSLERRHDRARADRLDGLRLDWPGRWLLVRPSNTEPIVRVIAEAETEDAACHLTREAVEILQGVVCGGR